MWDTCDMPRLATVVQIVWLAWAKLKYRPIFRSFLHEPPFDIPSACGCDCGSGGGEWMSSARATTHPSTHPTDKSGWVHTIQTHDTSGKTTTQESSKQHHRQARETARCCNIPGIDYSCEIITRRHSSFLSSRSNESQRSINSCKARINATNMTCKWAFLAVP